MSSSRALPVDELLEPLSRALETERAVVVEAPPGAGKTTRIPRALLESPRFAEREIWVTEPRRLAARLAASFVARELGEGVGGRVGYSVRFEDKTGPSTRLRYVTEGVLLRRLLGGDGTRQGGRDGSRGLGVVVLDEFHERHVATDLNLMLLARRLQREPDLRLLVMSATLNAEAVSAYLGHCPRLRCEGRVFPLTITHETQEDDRALPSRVSSAVKQLVRESGPEGGDVLVFLPGAAEINQTAKNLDTFAREQGIQLHTLHGEMPLEAQARAIAPSERRKVVLSTNVAESSVTVEGVTLVVDSGLSRVAEHSPWTGRQSLEIRPISQASAIQRAGRAGRTRPGRVHRLFTEQSFRARPAQDKPEVQRLDLTEPLLSLYGAGLVPRPEDWLDAPSPSALDSARELLERLGLSRGDALTSLGRRALALPLSPRLARVVLEGERLDIADKACLAAALLADRDIRLSPGGPIGSNAGGSASSSDLIGCDGDIDLLIELYHWAADERFHESALRRLGLHGGRVATVRQSVRQIRRDLASTSDRRDDDKGDKYDKKDRNEDRSTGDAQRRLSLSLLAGFPDRVARRRAPGGRDLILATGHVAELDMSSVAKRANLLLALDAEDRTHAPVSLIRGEKRAPRTGIRVRLAEPLEAEWLLDHAADQITEKETLEWDADRGRVQLTSQLCWGAVVLDQSERAAPPGPEAAALLERAALAQQANLFSEKADLDGLLARCALLARDRSASGFERVASAGMRELIALACRDKSSLAELRNVDFRELVLGELSPAERAELDREAPEWVVLGAGRRVRVHYAPDKPPWVESRLQDFFGMQQGPRVGSGRVPLTLHLLAPNQRAVQVTADLAGFWERHYASVRQELARRYPRHAWPEDGRKPPDRKPTDRNKSGR